MTLTLDSGAATTVSPPSTLPNQPLASGPTGAQYRSSSGQVIRNESVKEIATMYGCLRANVCATTKPLLAVSGLLVKGHRVEFAPERSCIILSSGRRLALKPGRGTFTVTLELARKTAGVLAPLEESGGVGPGADLAPGFQRQAQRL